MLFVGETAFWITTDYFEKDNTNNSSIGSVCGCISAIGCYGETIRRTIRRDRSHI